MQKIPELTTDGVPYKVYNIGNNKPESLMYFVDTLEECLLKEGVIKEKGNFSQCKLEMFIKLMQM